MKQLPDGSRAYIFWTGMWRHVHVMRTYEQIQLEGGSTTMAEFRLSKGTKVSYSAEVTSFRKTRPAAYKPRGRIAMKSGAQVRVGKRYATFIRVVVPKRRPYDAPTHALVQFDDNLGTSKVRISSIRFGNE